MKNVVDLFRNLRRLDLNDKNIQDSLYRISDWLSDEEHTEKDNYVQNQIEFLYKFISYAEENNKYYFTDI